MIAVVFVDVETDFLLNGPYFVTTIEDVNGFRLKDKFVEFALKCRSLGFQLFATVENGSSMLPELIKDELGSPIIPKGHIITKTTFADAKLARTIKECFDHLQEKRDCIFVCGIRTSLCVLSNTVFLNSLLPSDKIAIIPDLCADYTKDKTDTAINALKNLGILTTMSDKIVSQSDRSLHLTHYHIKEPN